MPERQLRVAPLTPRVGSEIVTDAATLVSGAAAAEIRAVLEERLAIVFPGVHLSPDQQVRFARTLGPVGNAERGGILKVSANPKVNPDPRVADYQRASVTWHFDGYTRGIPDYATILNARVLPPEGAVTEIASTVAAFEDLPADEQVFLETLQVVHDTETARRSVTPWPTYAQLTEWQRPGQKLYPLVWRAKSGRKSLAIGHSASHILGMSLPEGRALLCRLCEWAGQPQFVFRHHWKAGDLLLWDNMGALHRAAPYPEDSPRLLDRTALLGDDEWWDETFYALPKSLG
jgi:alpha-ketoglutarate-dependent taurine dioxygenase